MFRLDGKAALVTGASGGIGAAIARALHAQGAIVVLSGTRRDALEALGAELAERAHVYPADLRDASEPDALIAAAEAAAGPLAILVNNAGMTRDMLALRMRDEDWQAVLDVDLSAPFRLTRAALRGMLRRRAGRGIVRAGQVATGAFVQWRSRRVLRRSRSRHRDRPRAGRENVPRAGRRPDPQSPGG